MKNFVFFFADQQRAESLSCYGNDKIRTPHYDRMAREGTRFDLCFTQAAYCTPARCSLLTGWYPHVAGHRSLYHLLQPHEPNLFKSLKQAGHEVIALGKNDVFSREAVDLSLSSYKSHLNGNSGPPELTPDDEGYYSFLTTPFEGGPEETADMKVIKDAMDIISQRTPEDTGGLSRHEQLCG